MPSDEVKETPEYIRACLQVSHELIDEEYERIPGDLAYWSGAYADAYRAAQVAKLERERVAADLSLSIKERLSKKGKPTIPDVENHVQTHGFYLTAKLEEIEAESKRLRVQGVLKAVEAKKEMLISLGAHIRQEREHDPIIRSYHAQQRAMRRE